MPAPTYPARPLPRRVLTIVITFDPATNEPRMAVRAFVPATNRTDGLPALTATIEPPLTPGQATTIRTFADSLLAAAADAIEI